MLQVCVEETGDTDHLALTAPPVSKKMWGGGGERERRKMYLYYTNDTSTSTQTS
jgi:hypothetical protein